LTIYLSCRGLVELDEMRVIDLFRFYDDSMVMISGRAQTFEMFREMSTRLNTFKMMFNKLKFFNAWVNQGLGGLVRMIFDLNGAYFVEKLRQLIFCSRQDQKVFKEDE